MRFQYRYYGETYVSNSAASTDMRFVPDALRAPTHFVANINKHIPFREAISALHDVVVADQRYQPKDKTAYKEWVAQNEGMMLAQFQARSSELKEQLQPLQSEMRALQARKSKLMKPLDRKSVV